MDHEDKLQQAVVAATAALGMTIAALRAAGESRGYNYDHEKKAIAAAERAITLLEG